MIVAVEDALSEAVVRKLIAITRPDLNISVVLGKRGRGYIQTKARDLNKTARSVPVFILADLDRPVPCPFDLINQWLPPFRAPGLLVRVAVMEVESWVMAHREAFASHLGVPLHRIPPDTDTIARPKEFVVGLARMSKRKTIREDLVPSAGSTSAVGPAFNTTVSRFVTEMWDPGAASTASPSLRRAVNRLRAFRN
jgi:hypothetical protein